MKNNLYHSYNERNIVEIKNEYTTFLINILTPSIYEFLVLIYSDASKLYNQLREEAKLNPAIQIGNTNDILKIFQKCLENVPSMTNDKLEKEYESIKIKSKCSDWFDDLVKAVIRSYIVLLTYRDDKNLGTNELIKERYFDKVNVLDFIHKCLIETAREFYNCPYLFWHEFDGLTKKANQQEALKKTRDCIIQGIRKMLPIKIILSEYLKDSDVITEDKNSISESQYVNIQNLIKNEFDNNHDYNENMNGFAEVDNDSYDNNSIDSQDSANINEKIISVSDRIQQTNSNEEYLKRIRDNQEHAQLFNLKKTVNGGMPNFKLENKDISSQSDQNNLSSPSSPNDNKFEINSEDSIINEDIRSNKNISPNDTKSSHISKTAEISEFFKSYLNQ